LQETLFSTILDLNTDAPLFPPNSFYSFIEVRTLDAFLAAGILDIHPISNTVIPTVIKSNNRNDTGYVSTTNPSGIVTKPTSFCKIYKTIANINPKNNAKILINNVR